MTAMTEMPDIPSPEKLQEQISRILHPPIDSRFGDKPSCEFYFAAGTPVHTRNGLVPIEQLRAGDEVLSRHEHGTGSPAYKRVLSTRRTARVDFDFMRYYTDSTVEKLMVTKLYPWFARRVGWAIAGDVSHPHEMLSCTGEKLEAWESRSMWETTIPGVAIAYGHQTDSGCVIDLRGGTPEVIAEIGDDNIRSYEALWCQEGYGIEVEDFHTFYVGRLGAWVHDAHAENSDEPALPGT